MGNLPAPIETIAGKSSACPNPHTTAGNSSSRSDETTRNSNWPQHRPDRPHNTIPCRPNVAPQSRKIQRQVNAVSEYTRKNKAIPLSFMDVAYRVRKTVVTTKLVPWAAATNRIGPGQ